MRDIELATKLIYRGDRRFELIEEDGSPPGAGEVIVEVLAAGICGSDVHGYSGVNDRRPPGTVMGHEVACRVRKIGAAVDLPLDSTVAVWPIVACGECLSCAADRPHLCKHRRLIGCTPELPGGFATHMRVPERNLIVVPDDVPPEWGALVEPLAVGHHAVRIAAENLGDSVGVVGGGMIGVAAAIAARRRGVRDVVIVEPVERRRQIAERLGFDALPPEAIPCELETTFECVGAQSTVEAAIKATRRGGTVVCVGVAELELRVPVVALVIEERRLLGSSAYTRPDFVAVADMLDGLDLDLGVLIEARTDLVGAPQVFAAYAAGQMTAMKTLVLPRGSV